jgi:hypothetical protein
MSEEVTHEQGRLANPVSSGDSNRAVNHPDQGATLTAHAWPPNGAHVYGEWYAKNRYTEYRICVHPRCKVIEERTIT